MTAEVRFLAGLQTTEDVRPHVGFIGQCKAMRAIALSMQSSPRGRRGISAELYWVFERHPCVGTSRLLWGDSALIWKVPLSGFPEANRAVTVTTSVPRRAFMRAG